MLGVPSVAPQGADHRLAQKIRELLKCHEGWSSAWKFLTAVRVSLAKIRTPCHH
jgi:hypothetical protein